MEKLSSVIGFLEHAYDVTNERYFNGELPKVIISVHKAKNCFAYFSTNKVWKNKQGETFFEICITADLGINRDIYAVIATLIHEQVHCYCAIQDPPIKEVSRGGQYHNKIFRDLAVERDLIIDYDKRIGYSITSPSQNLIDFIYSQGWHNIDLTRTATIPLTTIIGPNGGDDGIDPTTGKKKTHIRKYICPKCGISTRASKEIRILCIDCQEQMVVA